MSKNLIFKKLNCHIVIQVCLFLMLLAADQVSKQFAFIWLQDSEGITVIDGILDLQFVKNTGAAFGIFKDARWLFYVISSAAILILVILYLRIMICVRRYLREASDIESGTESGIRIRKVHNMIALGCILAVLTAGAVGNLIDRIFRGYVIDFLYLRFIEFPVFNIADICVTLSVISLIIFFIFFYRDNDAIRIFGKAEDSSAKN